MVIDFDSLALGPCIAAFGQPCGYVPGAGRAVQLSGIFNQYSSVEKIDPQTGATMSVQQPTLAVRIADLGGVPLPCEGEQFIVAGKTWQIHDPTQDGFGQLLVKLIETAV